MASSTGVRHRRARKLATLVTVVACFSLPASANAAVLEQGPTVALPTITAGDVQILGPSTVRVQRARRHRNSRLDRVHTVRRGLRAQPAHGVHSRWAQAWSPTKVIEDLLDLEPGSSYNVQLVAETPLGTVTSSSIPFTLPAAVYVNPSTGGVVSATSTGKRTRCTIVGTAKSDKLVGTKKHDVICGLGGNDRIKGAGGNDLILSGKGNDRASGGAGNDTIHGNSGRDRMFGNAGKDRFYDNGGGKVTCGKAQPRRRERRLRPRPRKRQQGRPRAVGGASLPPPLELFGLVRDRNLLGRTASAQERVAGALERSLDLISCESCPARLTALLHGSVDADVLLEVHGGQSRRLNVDRNWSHTRSTFGASSASDSSGRAGTATSVQHRDCQRCDEGAQHRHGAHTPAQPEAPDGVEVEGQEQQVARSQVRAVGPAPFRQVQSNELHQTRLLVQHVPRRARADRQRIPDRHSHRQRVDDQRREQEPRQPIAGGAAEQRLERSRGLQRAGGRQHDGPGAANDHTRPATRRTLSRSGSAATTIPAHSSRPAAPDTNAFQSASPSAGRSGAASR